MQNNTIITDAKDFNIKQTLECGQLFRYTIKDNCAEVFSLDKKAVLYENNGNIIIENEDKEYFNNYFDLNCDYSQIKTNLSGLPLMDKAIQYGYGIRILRQDILETIISFIISANNNMPRIKKIIERMAEKYGNPKNPRNFKQNCTKRQISTTCRISLYNTSRFQSNGMWLQGKLSWKNN